MSTQTPVPSDIDPSSIIDLVNDCRELAGVLVGAAGNRSGVRRSTRVPAVSSASVGAPVAVTADLSATVAGYEDYGS